MKGHNIAKPMTNEQIRAAFDDMYEFIKSLLDVESLSMDHDEILEILAKARGE